MKKKIMIIQKIFPYYRKAVFDKLNEKTGIILVHSKNKSGIKQVNTSYSVEVPSINFSKQDTNVFLFTFKLVFKYKPKIIIHEFALGILSLPLMIILCRLKGIKLVLWSHGYDRKKGFCPKKSLMDKIRLMYLKSADAVILYGENDKKLLSSYIKPEKIFIAKNTFDTKSLLNIKDKFKKEGLKTVKKRLGFKHKYNLLFIGRLLKSKYPEIMIDIYNRLKNKLKNNLAIHFVGDGEMSDLLKAIAVKQKCSDNVFFHGAIYDDYKTGELLFCSDIMIIPGAIGLSVVHSFCFDCPVITFKADINGPFHGPEIDYVIHGKTGYQAKNYNIDDITNIVYKYLTNLELQKQIKKNINNFILNELSLDNMIKGFIECINYSLKG